MVLCSGRRLLYTMGNREEGNRLGKPRESELKTGRDRIFFFSSASMIQLETRKGNFFFFLERKCSICHRVVEDLQQYLKPGSRTQEEVMYKCDLFVCVDLCWLSLISMIESAGNDFLFFKSLLLFFFPCNWSDTNVMRWFVNGEKGEILSSSVKTHSWSLCNALRGFVCSEVACSWSSSFILTELGLLHYSSSLLVRHAYKSIQFSLSCLLAEGWFFWVQQTHASWSWSVSSDWQGRRSSTDAVIYLFVYYPVAFCCML